MSDLQDLIGIPLDKISDEELEAIMIHGRLAREESNVPKVKAAKKEATSKVSQEELDQFD